MSLRINKACRHGETKEAQRLCPFHPLPQQSCKAHSQVHNTERCIGGCGTTRMATKEGEATADADLRAGLTLGSRAALLSPTRPAACTHPPLSSQCTWNYCCHACCLLIGVTLPSCPLPADALLKPLPAVLPLRLAATHDSLHFRTHWGVGHH
jgi:hypothetical protein